MLLFIYTWCGTEMHTFYNWLFLHLVCHWSEPRCVATINELVIWLRGNMNELIISNKAYECWALCLNYNACKRSCPCLSAAGMVVKEHLESIAWYILIWRVVNLYCNCTMQYGFTESQRTWFINDVTKLQITILFYSKNYDNHWQIFSHTTCQC